MDAPTQKSAPREPLSARREREVRRITGRQLRLITTEQLLQIGFSSGAIAKRHGGGRLFRLHHGVYATHPPPYTLEQHWLAAVLACGPGALLSDLAAARHLRMTDLVPLVPQVTVASGRGRSRRGIEVHHRFPVDRRDVRRVRGVPCTSPDRTLIDLAPTLTEAELETMLVAAESKGLLKRRRLAELVEERSGRPGIAKLERIIALEPAITRSALELLFLPIWRDAGVERPRVNFPIAVPGKDRPLTADFAWPEIRMVVEADSQRFHGDWERAEADRERDQLLALAGWVCHRFVRRQIKHDPAGSARRLRGLTDARIAELKA